MSSSPESDPPSSGFLDVASLHQAHGLTAFGKFITLADGERVITEGEPQDALYFVMSGTLVVSTSAGVKPVRLATLGEGDSLGEVNLFDPDTASADVSSAGDSVIWRIRRAELASMLEENPQEGIALLKGLITQLSARMRLMNKKLLMSEQKIAAWNPSTP